MIGTVRRINLLTALVLLLSGLLHSMAVAQGVTCARSHAPARMGQPPARGAGDAVAGAADGPSARSIDHAHDSTPQPDPAGAPSAPCGVAAVPAERRLTLPVVTGRNLPPPGDLPPTSLLAQSVFRPPRLS